MNRDSFVMYRSFVEAIAYCPDDVRLRVFDAICRYALDGIEPSLEGMELALFTSFKPQIDANNIKYLNGKKGGAPKGSRNNPKGRGGLNGTNQELTTSNHNLPNDNVNDNVNVDDNVNDNAYQAFAKSYPNSKYSKKESKP